MRLIVLAAALALAGCATHSAAPPAPVAPACTPVKAYSADQLAQMAAAVRSLPADSPLRGLVVDYQRLRDEARAACGASAKP